MPTVVLTGMSGAGKQQAARYFEDMRWRVVDNLPPRLLPALLRRRSPKVTKNSPRYALCATCAATHRRVAPGSRHASDKPTLLFLDATDEALIQRFKKRAARTRCSTAKAAFCPPSPVSANCSRPSRNGPISLSTPPAFCPSTCAPAF